VSGAIWTSAEIASAVGGEAIGQWSVAGVSIDSRTVLPGELFIALRGPNHDGHRFIRAALDRGAAAMIDRLPSAVPPTAPLVKVKDTMAALKALGKSARSRSTARTAAITGSVGNTGTKEALRLALAAQAPTHASAASHNNHWGVPLSLARQPRATAFAVYELGMNAPCEIADLVRLVRPDVALITTIAPAHIGRFASLDEITAAKGEIFQGLEPGGTAVLNRDIPQFERLKAMAQAAECGRVIGFGRSEQADARLLGAELGADGSAIEMALDGQRLAFRIGAPGQHWVINSLAVIATAFALGADPQAAAAALADFKAPKGRGERHLLEFQGGEILLIDESYNANPTSMRAALDLLATAPGRRVVALGDMLELGEDGPHLHAELVEPILANGIDRVFTVGAAMRHLHAALPHQQRGIHVDQAAALLPILKSELAAGDTLLVKGSLGSAMGQIVTALLADHRAAGASGIARTGA
jgi:UDP-N-acetylmuramoyl-tripeptide--D-alanyl-D-alanine ligase